MFPTRALGRIERLSCENSKALKKRFLIPLSALRCSILAGPLKTPILGRPSDAIYNKEYLKDVYTEVDPTFTGKVTVPVLLDKKQGKIVNNESSEILRIFNRDLRKFSDNSTDYYPEKLKEEIDEVNEDIYHNINNGVYKTGFARTQEAYDHNFKSLFESLERQEKRLEGRDYLVGETLTEADIRFYTTLARFDAVYFTHFKCNKKLIQQFTNIYRYLKTLASIEEFQLHHQYPSYKEALLFFAQEH